MPMVINPTTRNPIVRHWRGELPLWLSAWVVTLVASASWVLLLRVLKLYDELHGFGARCWGISMLLAAAFLVASTVWLVVGVWKSADRARRRRGHAIWAFAAKTLMIFPSLRS